MASSHPPSTYTGAPDRAAPCPRAYLPWPSSLSPSCSGLLGRWGVEVGQITEKLSLYADDTLLYLPDTTASLEEALRVIDQFGSFSRVCINWTKSMLFPLSRSLPPLPAHIPLKVFTKFRFWGIEIQDNLHAYLRDNGYPILQQLTLKCLAWKSLLLKPVGRINLLKMTFLPKFLHIFRNTPVPIPNLFFKKLDRMVGAFVWAPRVAKATLQLPPSNGGLAPLCFKLYYWVVVLVSVRWWFVHNNPSVNLVAAILGSGVPSNLVFRGPKAYPTMTIPICTGLGSDVSQTQRS